MKRAILSAMFLVAAAVAACIDPPPESTATVGQNIEAMYCTDGLGPIDCWPDSPAQGTDWCMSNCGWFNDEPGYCPSYNSFEEHYCATHCLSDTINCGDFCEPEMTHRCVVGWAP